MSKFRGCKRIVTGCGKGSEMAGTLRGFPEFLSRPHSSGRRQSLVTRLIFVKF